MKSVCIMILIVLVSGRVPAQQSAELKQVLQHKIDSIRQAFDIPAMAFSCVLPSGELISVSSNMKPSQRMLAGSTGKTFFSSLALKLMAEGKFALDDKVSKYLGKESWYAKVQNAETITIRMLMNHTSGIDEYYELGDFTKRLRDEPDKTWKPEECIAYTLGRPPLFVAGSDWSYADTNYLILGLVIEKVTGHKAYDDIQSHIITRFKLNDTEPSVSRKLRDLINGITFPESPFGIKDSMIVNGKLIINPQMEWAGGGYISNTIDLARWAKLYYEASFTNDLLRKELRIGVPAKTGKDHQYGLGMQIRPSTLGMSYGHGGWFPGYLTEMDYFPEKNFTVAVQLATDDFRKLKRSPRFFEMFFASSVARFLTN